MKKTILVFTVGLTLIISGCSYFGASGAIRSFINAAEKRNYSQMIEVLKEKKFGEGSNLTKAEKEERLAGSSLVHYASSGIDSMQISEKIKLGEITMIEAKIIFQGAEQTYIFGMSKEGGKWMIHSWFNKKEFCKTPHPACE